MTDFDVCIIGCGPVGAMGAALLAREGLNVIVLEKEPAPYSLPRAVHLDHEMMRLFQSAGVIDRICSGMRETDGHLHIGADHGVIRYMGTVGKPRPFGWANDYFFYQPELEHHLRDALGEMDNVELLLGAEFRALDQDGAPATVRFDRDGAERTITARWVIACDGARSSVRKALGISLEDLDFEEPWLVVDAEVDGPVTFPPITGIPPEADLQRLSVMMCDPARPTTVVPGRGNHRRWEFMLLPGETDAGMMVEEVVAGLIEPWLKGVPHRIVRASTYRFHGLVAERWRAGNVFLAGDATHQTPPFFGQGMCHGFRDVANLAWKMAAVSRGEAGVHLLDTYERERDPHVRAVISAAIAAGRYICELDPFRAATRDRTVRAERAAKPNETAHDLIPAIATGLVRSGSPGAGERFIQPMAGTKMLDDCTGGGWRLFYRGEATPNGPRFIAAHDASRLGDGGAVLGWLDRHSVDAVLVRPDHYVFGSGDAVELLAASCAALGIAQESV